MADVQQTETFRKWRAKLKDSVALGLIASRLDRLAFGHAGDAKSLGGGVSELRIDHGPGSHLFPMPRQHVHRAALWGQQA